MLADGLDYVIGVDTHRDQHALAIVDAHTGALIAQTTAAATSARISGGGSLRRPARAECACLGDRRHRPLRRRPVPPPAARGEQVHEVERPSRGERRLRGKDDQLDAVRAARSSLAAHHRSRPRGGEHQEALRLLLLTRRSAVDTRRVALVQLRSVIVTHRTSFATSSAGCRSASYSTAAVASAAPASAHQTNSPPSSCCAHWPAASRPRPIEAETLEREILAHVRALIPELLDEPGIGPIVAAQLIVTWSHRDRVSSEACFARLAGVAPLPASSGLTTRHRLSRGGDRQLNRALHTIVLHRRQHDRATRDYIARRISEGKTSRDATRLLKRYLARHLYRVMQNASPAMT